MGEMKEEINTLFETFRKNMQNRFKQADVPLTCEYYINHYYNKPKLRTGTE